MIWTARAIVLLSVLSSPVLTQSPVPRPAQIILIRHAEKPSDPEDPHLSRAGVKRAEQLLSFIRTDPAMSKFGLPVAVFATQTTKHDNGQRTQETVAPLARALKLPVQTPFLGADYGRLAKLILANPTYAGKTVLICWNHEEIPELAAALGVTPKPPKWKAGVFDRVYVISYHGGTAALASSRYGSRQVGGAGPLSPPHQRLPLGGHSASAAPPDMFRQDWLAAASVGPAAEARSVRPFKQQSFRGPTQLGGCR